MSIIKTFNGVSENEITGGGTFTSLSWEDLLPAIGNIIRLRDDEVIDGFVVSAERINVKLSRKRGRKKESK